MNDGEIEVPAGWVSSPLGDVVRLVKDKVDPATMPDAPYVGLEHVEAHSMRLLGTGRGSHVKSTKTRFSAGDVLYGKLRPYLNKVASPDFDGICSTDFLVFGESPELDRRFLAHYLNQLWVAERAHHLSTGVELPRVDWHSLSEFPIAYPPRKEEQRAIAGQLDRVGRLRATATSHLALALRAIERFRQAILVAACSGRLTADWRDQHGSSESAADLFAEIQSERGRRFKEESSVAKSAHRRARWSEPILLSDVSDEELAGRTELPLTWMYCRLGNLAEIVRGASPRPAGDLRYFGGKIPWITVAELTKDDSVYLTKVRQFVTEEGKARSRWVEADTLLLTNSGATLGVPKITRLPGCINDGSVALVDIPLNCQLYLYYFLKTQTTELRAINQGAAQPNLNTDIVRNIVTPLPPRLEQLEILRRVGQLLGLAEGLQARVETAAKRTDRSLPPILAKALRGQLTLGAVPGA